MVSSEVQEARPAAKGRGRTGKGKEGIEISMASEPVLWIEWLTRRS